MSGQKMKYGICGNLAGTRPEDNPYTSLKNEAVQVALFRLNEEPQPKDRVLTDPDIGTDMRRLLNLGFLREDGDRLRVNFTLFSRDDKELVTRVSQRHAEGLAEEIDARRAQVFEVLSNYRNPLVSPERLAFMIIGCYFLDWGALDLLNDWGIINSRKKQAGDTEYTLWGEADVSGSLKAVYWGGHSMRVGPYLLHTFGDHSLRRYSLPDLLWARPKVDFDGVDDFQSLLSQKRAELGEELGLLLHTVGYEGVTRQGLTDELQWDEGKLEDAIRFLAATGYLAGTDGSAGDDGATIRLLIPYFTEADIDIMVASINIVISVLKQWLEESLAAVERDLAGLNSIRNEVPFSEVFVQVWHYIFGYTNKELACRGFLFDTYCEGSTHPGHVPAMLVGNVLKQVQERAFK